MSGDNRRVALVTGASSGIGRATAIALAEAGYNLIIAGRRETELAITQSLMPPNVRVLSIPTDVTDAASVAKLFGRIKDEFGRLDLLFNNAGISAFNKPIEDLSLEDWHHTIQTNITGIFLCTQAAFTIMRDQTPRGGRIINNGSVSAHVPRPNSVAYTASKHAVTGLTKSTSLDGRAHNIACGQIDIGNAATDMTAAMGQGVLQANGTVAVEPLMDAKIVGDAVVFMASLPLSANVLSMNVMATAMPFVGRG